MEANVGPPNLATNTPPLEFFVGQVFDNEEEAKAFLKEYNKRNFTEIRIRSNHKKAMVFTCKHGVKRTTRSKDIRPHTHFNYVGCTVKINFYKSQVEGNTSVRVTQVNLQHNNHEVNQVVYNQANVNLTEGEEDLVKILKDANTTPSRIQKVLLQNSNKRVHIQKLKNLVAKIAPVESEDDTRRKFEDFLDDTSTDGGIIEWETDPDGTVKTMFITSSKMKSAFRNNNPPVVQLDTTFNMEKALYKIAAFVYLDPNTNLSEIAAFSLLSQESASSFEFILGHFANICVRQDLIFLIDKDFTEVSSLRKVFPSSTVLLCIFHVLKYIKNLVTTALARQEKKHEIFSQFKKVLYSRTEAIFVKENKTFLEIVKDIEVRAGKGGYVKLSKYYSDNWESSKLMWVKCYRNSLPLLGDDTSNRVEASFRALKQSVEDTFVSVPKTIHAIMHLVQFADVRLQERYCKVTNRVLRIFHQNEEIRTLNEEASKELNDRGCKLFNKVLGRLEEKRKDLSLIAGGVKESFSHGEFKDYITSPTSCNCSFFANNQAPCFHILFIRRLDHLGDPGQSIFDKNIFNIRYHRNSRLINILTVPGESEVHEETSSNSPEDDVVDDMWEEPVEVPAMDDKKKYKTVMPILSRIANLISAHGTKQFLNYVEDLEIIETRIRRGRRIFKLERAPLDDIETDSNNNDDARETGTDDPQSQASHKEGDVDTEVFQEPVANESQTQTPEEKKDDENVEVDPSKVVVSKFNNLSTKFKEAVKPKGRPKKKSKQVTFNKTSLDRGTRASKPAVRKPVKRKDFVEEVNDLVSRPKRARKSAKKSTEGVVDIFGDEDDDIMSDDSGSYKPDNEALESGEHLQDEDAFNKLSKKPKCDKCGRNILKFSELTECDLCFEPIHEDCLKAGCRRCVVEDEFY